MNTPLKTLLSVLVLMGVAYAGYVVLVNSPAGESIAIAEPQWMQGEYTCEHIPDSWRYLDSEALAPEHVRGDIGYTIQLPEWWKVVQVPDRTEGMVLLAVDETRLDEQTLLKEGVRELDWLAVYRFDTFFTSYSDYEYALYDTYRDTRNASFGMGIEIHDAAPMGTLVRDIWVGGERGQVLRFIVHSPRGQFAESIIDCSDIHSIGYHEGLSVDSYNWSRAIDPIIGFVYSYPDSWFYKVIATPMRAFDAREFYNQDAGGVATNVRVDADDSRARPEGFYLSAHPEIVNSSTQGNANGLVLEKNFEVAALREGRIDGYSRAYRARMIAVGDMIAFTGMWGSGPTLRTMAHTYVSLEP